METKKDIASRLIQRFPKAATRTLASKLYQENKSLFKNSESARGMIRKARGSCGEKSRSKATVPRPIQPNGTGSFAKMPEPWIEMPDWNVLQIDQCRALILSDVHVPYHDKTSLNSAVAYGKAFHANTIILNGDICDCFAVSYYMKDPRQRKFAQEIASVKAFLEWIRGQFPKARIVLKLGNHDERLENYLQVKAPELLDLECLNLQTLLDLESYRIEIVRDMRVIRLGKLNVLHGHEYRFSISNPVNPARGLFLRAKAHVIVGHFHKSSQHSEKTLEDNVVSTWSTGCLCNMRPRYCPLNMWNHGAATVEVDSHGAFHVDNKRIIDGKIY